MPATRRARATFTRVRPATRGASVGVDLQFRPLRSTIGVDYVDDFAELGPEMCIPAVAGLGKVLRILRAARIAAPEAAELLGRQEAAAELLERALGTALALELRPRTRIRFLAWTEEGLEIVDDVSEVIETPEEYLVMRRRSRIPRRIARESVVRRRTDCERWFEVVSIERA